MLHELPDGTLVRLRYIAPDDKPLLARGLAQLSHPISPDELAA